MKILGIDPGTAIVGWGIIETEGRIINNQVIPKVLGCGVISTRSGTSNANRLEIIFDEVSAIIDKERPDFVAVEQLFFFKNQKTIMTVSESRGVIVLAIQKTKAKLSEYTPLQVKQAVCGYGRADKRQVQEMVKTLLRLKAIPKPDDAADALAIALCCAQSYRR